MHFAYQFGRDSSGKLVRRLTARGVERVGRVEHEGGDRSIYFEDPEGNVVEAWDFFERGDGARAGVEALKESGFTV